LNKHRPPLILVCAGGFIAAAIALPLIYLVIRTMGIEGGGFWALITRPRILMVLFNSVAVAAAVTLFSLLLALPLAFLTLRTDLPFSRFWSIATTLPLAVPSYVGSFALLAAFAPRGSFLQLSLQSFGVEELPSIYGFPGTVLAITLFTYPYLLLSVRAGWQGLDPALTEASRSLGYTSWQTFWRVTLPQLRPAIVSGSFLVSLYALRDFGTPSLMRFDTFTRAIFVQYKSSFDRNTAAGLALMLVMVVMCFLWLEYRARKKGAYYSRNSANARSVPRIKLGKWTVPAVIFCGLVAALGVVLPVAIAFIWLWQGFQQGYDWSSLGIAAFNSVLASVLAGAVTIVFAVAIAILAVRFPSRSTAIIERASYLSFGMPGIAVALSLVSFGANYLPWLYQTMPMLIIAYLILFLPESLGTVRNTLLQIDPHLEESSRSLGRNGIQTIWEVTLPLLKAGLAGGAILVFLTTIKELPATMLLAPIGFETLAIKIWDATDALNFANAAIGALGILVVSMGSTILLVATEKGHE
jgi:iron(III) transport system permease protein